MIHRHKSVLAFIVLVAWCGNVMAAALCPHLNGKICCTSPGTNGHENVRSHQHMDSMPMPMDGMNMPGAQTTEVVTSEASLNEVVTSTSAINDTSSDNAACPHCLMHSQSTLVSRSASGAGTSDSRDAVASSANVLILEMRSSLLYPQDPRDHGPPGPTHPRYIVNSTFRI